MNKELYCSFYYLYIINMQYAEYKKDRRGSVPKDCERGGCGLDAHSEK